MTTNLTKNWFGDHFSDLHPLLQKLHVDGGTLSGDVKIQYGAGLAGLIGKRLANKMTLPAAGDNQLTVDISHDEQGLHWSRCFNGQNQVKSLFKPVGSIGEGHWIETTGPLTMNLTVDVIDGGWHWRTLAVQFMGLPIPKWLLPQTKAYKTIQDDQYRFHVEFSYPIIGSLVRYSGLLKAEGS